MITTSDLKTHTKADLAEMAKRLGIAGSSAMRKDDLVAAVAKASRSSSKANSNSTATRRTPKQKSTRTESSASKGSPAQVTSKKRAGGVKSAAKSVGSNKPAQKKPVAKKGISEDSGKPRPASRSKASGRSAASVRSSSSAKSKVVAASATGDSSKLVASKSKGGSPANKISEKSEAKRLVAQKKKASPKAATTSPKILKRIRELQLQRNSSKDISFRPSLVKSPGATEPIWEKEPVKDRLALFVRDAYWMHASWDITRQAIDRAKAAMAEQWHSAKPVLRLLRIDDTGTTTTSETVERDIEIHGGLRNWYIEWSGESASFRVMVGYLSHNGRFHAICESNTVKTPSGSSSEAVDEHWADLGPDSERIFALSGGYDSETETRELKELLEDRLHRNLGAPPLAQLGAGTESPFRRKSDFHFDMDIELVLYGSTVPDGYMTLNGEPVTLREDGTFVVRLPFPDRRQVLPAVACSRDGSHQRTIVVAVERNTKIMEPLEAEKDTGE